MDSILVQDWTYITEATVGAGGAIYSVAQDSESWVDVSSYVDAVFFVDVRYLTNPTSGGSIQINLESAPSRDESLFLPCVPPLISLSTLFVGAPTQVMRTAPAVSGTTLQTSPLAKWLRWRISVPSTASGGWNLAFRIRMAGTPFPFFNPTQLALPGSVATLLKLWLRADLGLTFSSGTTVSGWADQSGNGNNFSATGSPTFSASGLNGMPAIVTSSGNYLTATGSTVAQGDSMFVVLQETTPSANLATFIDGRTGNQQTASQQTVATTLNVNAGTSQTTTVAALTTSSIIQVDWSGGSTAVYQNGTAVTAPGNVGTGSIQLGYIGVDKSGTTSPFPGNIAEIILFSQILSATNRARVNRYLGGRYGIVVP